MNLDQVTLKGLLAYDPETGIFTRLVRTAKRVRVGDVAGSLNAQGYRYIRIGGGQYKANRLAWLYVHGCWPEGQVDHINGEKDDDRIANLRDCSNAHNSQNRRSPKGAYKHPKGGYSSVVTVAGKRHYLGRFKTREAARRAYVDAKARLHPFQDAENLRA